jgi:disulfide bond formation protein DsbB
MTEFIKQVLPIITIVGDIIIIGGILLLLVSRFNNGVKRVLDKKVIPYIAENAVRFSLIVACVATLGSLFYSEVLGYNPCKLCWFQRIFMYPQVLLLLVAYVKQETKILSYTIYMSIIGLVIAVYHYLLQFKVVSEITPCSVVGYSQSCSDHFILQYGYITIPIMAVTAFLLLIGSWYAVYMKEKK